MMYSEKKGINLIQKKIDRLNLTGSKNRIDLPSLDITDTIASVNITCDIIRHRTNGNRNL